MRSLFWLLGLSLLWAGPGRAVDIETLLDAAARQPGHEIRALSVAESGLQEQRAAAGLFPRLGLYGRFESYNSPTNLRPMPPTEVNVQAGDSLPFSREILRYGLSFDAPVYVRELYVLRQKAALLREKAETDRQMDLLGRQAAVVSLNGALAYFEGLETAIGARRASLQKSLEDMAVKVKTGRSAEVELLKIQKTLNDLDQQRNDLSVRRLDTLREIEALTGMALSESVPMSLAGKPEKTTALLPVAAARWNADAARSEVQRRQAARWPVVSIAGFVSGNEGEAYNTDRRIDRDYHEVALVLRFSLFDRALGSDEAIARVQAEKAQKQLDQTRIDTAILDDALARKLPIIESSIDLARQSIQDSHRLLAVARVALRAGRMTLEDYLRYESDVLAAEAALHQARQQWWQVLSQQAALYGMDLKGVVK